MTMNYVSEDLHILYIPMATKLTNNLIKLFLQECATVYISSFIYGPVRQSKASSLHAVCCFPDNLTKPYFASALNSSSQASNVLVQSYIENNVKMFGETHYTEPCWNTTSAHI